MLEMKNSILFILLISALTFACNKVENFADEPKITQASYTLLKNSIGQDTAVLLKFRFTDGDGDLGVSQNDTSTNLFIDYLEMENGLFKHIFVPNDSTNQILNFNSRINEYSSGPGAEGEVEYSIDISFVFADTIRFDYYLRDKAYHKSNLITTGPIILH